MQEQGGKGADPYDPRVQDAYNGAYDRLPPMAPSDAGVPASGGALAAYPVAQPQVIQAYVPSEYQNTMVQPIQAVAVHPPLQPQPYIPQAQPPFHPVVSPARPPHQGPPHHGPPPNQGPFPHGPPPPRPPPGQEVPEDEDVDHCGHIFCFAGWMTCGLGILWLPFWAAACCGIGCKSPFGYPGCRQCCCCGPRRRF